MQLGKKEDILDWEWGLISDPDCRDKRPCIDTIVCSEKLKMSQSLLVSYVSSISYVLLTDLANFKVLLIKIKVIKGFSAKLKVLKDCNQIKGFERF